jgi:hypothetical protein
MKYADVIIATAILFTIAWRRERKKSYLVNKYNGYGRFAKYSVREYTEVNWKNLDIPKEFVSEWNASVTIYDRIGLAYCLAYLLHLAVRASS